MENSYRLVIIPKGQEPLELDVVDDKSVNVSITLTSHPTVKTGENVSDHMYKNQDRLNVSGAFGMMGRNSSLYRNNKDRLTSVQTTFENLMKEGTFCKLISLKRSNDGASRFKVRENMVLASISWTELQNSLKFNFQFIEVIRVETQEIEIDETDDELPTFTDPNQLDFTSVLLDWSKVDQIVNQVLKDNGLMEGEFDQYLKKYVAGSIEVIAGVSIGVALVTTTLSNPLGWLIGAVVLVGLGINTISKGLDDWNKAQQYRIDQFKYYEDDRKMQQELERYNNFIGEIHKTLMTLNDSIFLYGLSSDTDQVCTILIDDEYYKFSFTKNHSSGMYDLKITDINDLSVANSRSQQLVGLADITQCNKSNYVLRSQQSGYYVYVMNPALSLNDGKEEEYSKDLRNYMILVTSIDLTQFQTLVSEMILNSIKY